jgi:peroxiredoxin
MAVVILFISMWIIFHVLRHLPIIDFRPYAIGNNISEGMIIPEGAPESVYEDTWMYEVNGEVNEYTSEEKPWNIEGATFVDRKTKLISEGYVPPIHDFTMQKEGVDIAEDLLGEEKLLLVVMYNLDKSKKSGLKRVKELTDKAMEKGYVVYGFSASTEEDFNKLKEAYHWDFDLLFCDETTLKTIIRANPGIVELNEGTVVGKWNFRDFNEIKLR